MHSTLTVVVDKDSKECLVKDIAVPRDTRVPMKEEEKHDKCRKLCKELTKLWKVKCSHRSGDWTTRGSNGQINRISRSLGVGSDSREGSVVMRLRFSGVLWLRV